MTICIACCGQTDIERTAMLPIVPSVIGLLLLFTLKVVAITQII